MSYEVADGYSDSRLDGVRRKHKLAAMHVADNLSSTLGTVLDGLLSFGPQGRDCLSGIRSSLQDQLRKTFSSPSGLVLQQSRCDL